MNIKSVFIWIFILTQSIISLQAQNACQSFGWVNFDGQTNAGSVTGGGSATPIQVTTFAELKQQAESSGSKVIYVMNDMGNGYKGTTGDVLNVASDKTIIGFKPGITVKCSWQIKRVSNIIIKNLICRGPGNSNSQQNWDCVNIENSQRIWFDHCTIMEGEDGNFDVVKGSDNVTASWCKFTYVTGGDHNLSNLIGSSDTETQSHGKLNVTYAYCWWDNVNSRCPRTRYGKIHVLNCYYNNVGSGAYAGFMSNVRVEGCYFESNVSNPTGLISTGGQAGVFAIDCNRGSTMTDGYNSPFTPPYAYEKFPTSEVKSKVTDPNCGAGPTLDSPSDCGCSVADCNGVNGGTAYLDDCDRCVGGNTGKTACVLDCNGDENGTASVDACGICSGGNTGLSACSSYIEAEAYCDRLGVAESDNAGYIGTGYLNFENVTGSYGEWYLNSTTAQTVTLNLRYANGGTSARPMSVSVNGNVQTTFSGAQTGSWTNWQSESVSINLSSGINTLNLTATTSDGGPNLDLITLPAGISAGGCTEDCHGDIGGSASPDLCGICSGGNTGIEPNSQCAQDPYNGTPHEIPGRIEAEEYDMGGEGIAFHEANTDGNQGGATFRNDEVDIETTSDVDGNYNIGYVLNGEWLEYTVNVLASGVYNLQLRVAADGEGKQLHIEMDDADITGPVNIPNTGGWQTWQTVTVHDISLTEGEYILRIAFDSDYMNLNYLQFNDVITGISNYSEITTNPFPNPFSNATSIETEIPTKYKIHSTRGENIESGTCAGKCKLGENLKPGMYFLTVEQEGSIQTYKVFKTL